MNENATIEMLTEQTRVELRSACERWGIDAEKSLDRFEKGRKEYGDSNRYASYYDCVKECEEELYDAFFQSVLAKQRGESNDDWEAVQRHIACALYILNRKKEGNE